MRNLRFAGTVLTLVLSLNPGAQSSTKRGESRDSDVYRGGHVGCGHRHGPRSQRRRRVSPLRCGGFARTPKPIIDATVILAWYDTYLKADTRPANTQQ